MRAPTRRAATRARRGAAGRSGTAIAARRGTRRNRATSAAPTSATVTQYLSMHEVLVDRPERQQAERVRLRGLADEPRDRGTASGSASATSTATAVATLGRGAPISTQASSATTRSGTRKKRYRSWTRSEANREANIATARLLHASSATVAARCSCRRARADRARARRAGGAPPPGRSPRTASSSSTCQSQKRSTEPVSYPPSPTMLYAPSRSAGRPAARRLHAYDQRRRDAEQHVERDERAQLPRPATQEREHERGRRDRGNERERLGAGRKRDAEHGDQRQQSPPVRPLDVPQQQPRDRQGDRVEEALGRDRPGVRHRGHHHGEQRRRAARATGGQPAARSGTWGSPRATSSRRRSPWPPRTRPAWHRRASTQARSAPGRAGCTRSSTARAPHTRRRRQGSWPARRRSARRRTRTAPACRGRARRETTRRRRR